MQKIVYLSNSRDYNKQRNINENIYFKQVNELLEHGWTVAHMTPYVINITNDQNPAQKESLAAFVLLEKGEKEEKCENNENNK